MTVRSDRSSPGARPATASGPHAREDATSIAIGLGSNLGDRARLLRCAVERLAAHPDIALEARSPVVESVALGPPQPDYLNQVVSARTRLDPRRLLRLCKRIEWEAGRRPGARWGARPLDLDLLVYGDLELDTPALRLPHPGIAAREFVLGPWADIEPGRVIPGLGATVSDLWQRWKGEKGARLRPTR